ncbi:MAG: hypothetical protein KFF45_03160 [Thioalkalivibrio sp.]|nr:hypothetical protein [Thioalkalivibrio sp.]
MSRLLKAPGRILRGLPAFLIRYFGWLALSGLVTLGGGTVIMLFKEWSLLTILASQLVWPRLMLGMLIAIPIALFPVGRFYFISAIVGGLAYHLLLLIL